MSQKVRIFDSPLLQSEIDTWSTNYDLCFIQTDWFHKNENNILNFCSVNVSLMPSQIGKGTNIVQICLKNQPDKCLILTR